MPECQAVEGKSILLKGFRDRARARQLAREGASVAELMAIFDTSEQRIRDCAAGIVPKRKMGRRSRADEEHSLRNRLIELSLRYQNKP